MIHLIAQVAPSPWNPAAVTTMILSILTGLATALGTVVVFIQKAKTEANTAKLTHQDTINTAVADRITNVAMGVPAPAQLVPIAPPVDISTIPGARQQKLTNGQSVWVIPIIANPALSTLPAPIDTPKGS